MDFGNDLLFIVECKVIHHDLEINLASERSDENVCVFDWTRYDLSICRYLRKVFTSDSLAEINPARYRDCELAGEKFLGAVIISRASSSSSRFERVTVKVLSRSRCK